MDESYPDYRVAALKCLSDAFPDIPWSEIQGAHIKPIPPSGCWRAVSTSRRRFFVYVGSHPKAPSAIEVDEDQFNCQYESVEVENRDREIENIESEMKPIAHYTMTIGRKLQLKSVKERAISAPWKGEPAWLKEMIPDPVQRREYWNRTLREAGVIIDETSPSTYMPQEERADNIAKELEVEVKRANRDLFIVGAIVLVIVVVGVVTHKIPPFVLVSLGVSAVLIWQKNR